MSFSEAATADKAGMFEVAASAYEAALAGEKPSLELLLNLAVLYWQATDYGVASEKKLDAKFVAMSAQRVPVLIHEAGRVCSQSVEVEFWKRYIAWADFGDEFSVEECREFRRRSPDVLVPAMFIFAQSGGVECEGAALELLEQCKQNPTTRNRYVASVVEGVLRRRGGRK